jgi:hypothetical protein
MGRTLLQALLRNESGGRNIPNVHQGTSSGQAQGYFQITTGTWDEFGGRQYAPDPLHATYAQQAAVASRIPLKRWDPSTIAMMRATGRPIDPNRTLGENLTASGESFEDFGLDRMSNQYKAANASPTPNASLSPQRPAEQFWPGSGQAELSSQGRTPYSLDAPSAYSGGLHVRHPPNPTVGTGMLPSDTSPAVAQVVANQQRSDRMDATRQAFQDASSAVAKAANWNAAEQPPAVAAARVDPQAVPVVDQQQAMQQRQMLAMLLQRLNQGSLV